MTGPWLLRLVARLFTLAIAAVAGAYLVVYLYRWEWNRAVISGLFLLAAEVAYVGWSIRTEISGLRARIDALEGAADQAPPAAPGSPPSGARPARSFAWLRESASGGLGVFVPVLLGAGVILSGIALIIERLASAVVKPPAAGGPARRLVPLEVPARGLLGPSTSEGGETGVSGGPRRFRGLAVRVIALVVSVVLIVAAIDILADATQSRPSPRVPGAATVVELSIEQQRPRPALRAAEALTVACNGTVHADSEFTEIAAVGDDRVRIEVTPALSETRRRRLFGCLQDATLDLVQAHVVSWSTEPAGQPQDVS